MFKKVTGTGTVEAEEILPKNQELIGKVIHTHEKSGKTKQDTCTSICRLKSSGDICLSDDYALILEHRTHKLKKAGVKKNNYIMYRIN